MSSPYLYIDVQPSGDVLCVSLKDHQLEDSAIRAMSDEIEAAVLRADSRKLVLSLGELTCLYSLLIAKLIKLRRLMSERHGSFKLCNISPEIRDVMESCQLQTYFDLSPDCDTAVKALSSQ